VSQHLLAFLALFGDRIVELAVSGGLFVVRAVFRMRVLGSHAVESPPQLQYARWRGQRMTFSHVVIVRVLWL
jgi:hypothetical protein